MMFILILPQRNIALFSLFMYNIILCTKELSSYELTRKLTINPNLKGNYPILLKKF